MSFGFLDADTDVDAEVCAHLATSLANVPWTFHDAVDDTLDPRRAWQRLVRLPGLVNVRSAGSPRGMAEGYDDLLATAEADPAIAALLMPGGGLLAEHVPWLVRTGVRAFHLDEQLRPGGSRKAYVDAGLTRSWRLLLDNALERDVTLMIDPPAVPSRGRMWSHLASDTSFDELHAFARELGIPERGFDRDHYDVPSEWYDEVLARGVEAVTSRELVTRLVGGAALTDRRGASADPVRPQTIEAQLALEVGPGRRLPPLPRVRRVEEVGLGGQPLEHVGPAG